MKKTTVFSGVIGLIILLVIVLILPQYEQMLDFHNTTWVIIYSILLSLLYLLFGIFIELKRVIKIYSKRNVSVNWLLLSFVVILIVVVFVPDPFWFRPSLIMYYFFSTEVQVILNVLAGILLVRAFDKVGS
ncbi:hypothetical protein [Bacillus alkalicellulosilyticus]|uniref:hypothetical protein n=1 Tax=Alkalihalobacterium alkalicellulosilyticum TaxID=1912214 RepID=UPI0009965662|nr:hypothetical protein [Bacillus alkalicellulosilyticus]